MNITRLSSSSLETAMSCLASFKAKYVDRASEQQGVAAGFGTCVHAALEMYVQLAYLEGRIEKTWAQLLDIWKMHHAAAYSSIGGGLTEFKLGETILKRWHERGDLDQPGRVVLSVEEKLDFKITVDGVEITFVYIRDRLDRLPDGSLAVVDYKTSAWNTSPDIMRDEKIQPAVYALATQIENPDAPGVWVEFDMLKHENQPIGIYFSQEDSKKTWVALKREIRKILQAPDNPKPTLNSTCLFCPIKTTCPAVLANATAGGYLSMEVPDMVDRLAELEYQAKAAKAAANELIGALIPIAKERDVFDLEGLRNSATVKISRRRDVDSERVKKILGPELWEKYGSGSIPLPVIDALLKGTEISAEQKAEIREHIGYKYGEPSLSTKTLTSLKTR